MPHNPLRSLFLRKQGATLSLMGNTGAAAKIMEFFIGKGSIPNLESKNLSIGWAEISKNLPGPQRIFIWRLK